MNKYKYNQGRTSNKLANQNLNPELNHHLLYGRRSGALAHALPTLNGRWNSSSQKPAFTIIEVVLVLAIAGLIFLMVFIALPALQRSQRDTQRKRDVDNFLSAVQRYQANNRGRIPPSDSTLHNFKLDYLKISDSEDGGRSGEFRDPSNGGDYIIVHNSSGAHPGIEIRDDHNDRVSPNYRKLVFYIVGAKCDGQTTVPVNGSNKVAIAMALEGGGVYCVNN